MSVESKPLEPRLTNYAITIISFTNHLKSNYAANHLKKQLIRSSISSALNYSEAVFAQSKKDFVHKLSLTLKELHECKMNLKIIKGSHLILDPLKIHDVQSETNELIAICVTSLKTAKANC